VPPHAVPAGSVTSVHVGVPLQLRSTQSVDVQSTGVPAQVEPLHRSLYVQRSPSSQRESPARQRQVPPWFVQ
jgi:hypothetical protein